MSSHWQTPRACTVIGAAHRRQGSPCQDASLGVTLKAPGGGALQLMVVADGHGASRYWLSQVGSQLACRQAHQAVANALQHTPLEAEAQWRELLQWGLPASISQSWQTAIEADWNQRPETSGQDFSALSYGCTLGLVLMAPHWWGCTGLGDWDLVSIDCGGIAQLRSEESGAVAGGEATASLCLPEAERLFAQRAHLERLEGEQPLSALVLSTDGVRKSCATDHDFLSLCAQVIHLQNRDELAQGLAQISAEGSGDDVSLAMAQRARAALPPGPTSRPASPTVTPTDGTEAGGQEQVQGGGQWRGIATAGALVALMAATGGVWWLLQQGPSHSPAPGARSPTPMVVDAEGLRLCAQPTRIRASLSQRQAQFQRVLRDPAQSATLLADASRDPLGALIATSRLQRQSRCPALELALQEQWRLARAALLPPGGKMPAVAPP